MKALFYLSVWFITMFCMPLAWADEHRDANPATPVWREEFNTMPAEWNVKTKPGTKSATFRVEQSTNSTGGLLVMEADKASATFMVKLKSVSLKEVPLLRWRWCVTTFPEGADGRVPEKDDQAIGIYVSAGGLLNQHSISYRWETDTPVGAEGTVTYAGGIAKIKWICLRNKEDGESKKFFVEERNVADDFKKAFGFIPDKIGIGISCNSQYTGARAVAQLDWIEFFPAQSRTGILPVYAGKQAGHAFGRSAVAESLFYIANPTLSSFLNCER